jgi:hypothetical protein
VGHVVKKFSKDNVPKKGEGKHRNDKEVFYGKNASLMCGLCLRCFEPRKDGEENERFKRG